MKAGRRPDTPAQHAARGTARPDRLAGRNVIEAPAGNVAPPEGALTEEGAKVWADRAPQAQAAGMLKAPDVEQFAIFCNLVAFIREAHRRGEPAPAQHYAEMRRQAEMFGLAGEQSRPGMAGGDGKSAGQFARNGQRNR